MNGFWKGFTFGIVSLLVFVGVYTHSFEGHISEPAREFIEVRTVIRVPIDVEPRPDRLFVDQHLEEQAECLALNVYHEARGEGDTGMVAVMHVTRNRVLHVDFPDTYCEVIFQGCYQFSWVCDESVQKIKDFESLEMIRDMTLDFVSTPHRLFPDDPTAGATHYHSEDLGDSLWGYEPTTKIGSHIFFDHYTSVEL